MAYCYLKTKKCLKKFIYLFKINYYFKMVIKWVTSFSQSIISASFICSELMGQRLQIESIHYIHRPI